MFIDGGVGGWGGGVGWWGGGAGGKPDYISFVVTFVVSSCVNGVVL